MQDAERVIGKLEEFQEWAKKHFDLIEKDFELVRRDIELLNKFKWQVYGGAALISSFVALGIEILRLTMMSRV